MQKIIKITKRIVFAVGGILGVFLIIFLASASVRTYLTNSFLAAPFIDLYNAARPALNFGNNNRCLKRLAQTGLAFTRVADRTDEPGCALRRVVKITAAGGTVPRPLLVTCSLALSLVTFEQDVLQPAAKEYFQQKVTAIRHLGAYNCRPMTGSQRLLSEHAYANAIDITAFQLADGTLISIKNHWQNAGAKTKFLHEIAQRACGRFRTVLTPNYNAAHKDHFHFDNGLFGQCGY